MSRIEAVLRRSAGELADRRCRWALIGGLAVSIRAEPRFTRDVDLAVSVATDRDAERLVVGLQGEGYRVQAVVEQAGRGRLATTRLIPPGEDHAGVVLDLLFASSGIEPEVVAGAEPIEILPGLRAPVARTGHLIVLKLLLRDHRTRPQDTGDLAALAGGARQAELARAREAVALIRQRGFHRGRDLEGDLDRLLRDRDVSPA